MTDLSVNLFKDKINSFYNPKKIVTEPKVNFNISKEIQKRGLGRDVNGVMSMFYKIEACNKLKLDYEQEHNFKYDCVIRCRADLLFQQEISINTNTDFKHLYVPKFGDFGGLNDQFAYGSSEIMDQYSSLFSKFYDYVNDGIIINPELLILHHVKTQNLDLLRPTLKYIIKRTNGSYQDNEELERKLGFIK